MRLLAALAVVVVARLIAFALFPLCAEDAYITFHAALDPAWRVAVTSPLWALLVSPQGMPEVMARFWTLVADCVAVWAAWRILPKLALWAFVALWCSPFFTGSAVGGLETHAVAALLLVARVHPIGYALGAMFRPDAALLALCASGRKWLWALSGAVGCAALGILYSGHGLPQTVTSKLAAYGVHPGAWQWLHPQGFGWMTVAIGLALFTAPNAFYWRRPLMQVWAAIAFLLIHVLLGTPQFWWYAVPPLAMLGLAACEQVKRPWHLWLAFAVIAGFAYPQAKVLLERTDREAQLWKFGQILSDHDPTGTILLEPAGMIPYENRQLRAIDDVGLIDPWMAKRRALGAGWRTDAINRYHPQWLVVRMREYIFPGTWTIGPTCPYYGPKDSVLPDFVCIAAPGVIATSPGWAKAKMVSSNLLILMRMPGH